MAGIDHRGPQLFHADPSGTFIQYDAKAIGAGAEVAQTQLQSSYRRVITEPIHMENYCSAMYTAICICCICFLIGYESR